MLPCSSTTNSVRANQNICTVDYAVELRGETQPPSNSLINNNHSRLPLTPQAVWTQATKTLAVPGFCPTKIEQFPQENGNTWRRRGFPSQDLDRTSIIHRERLTELSSNPTS